MIPVTRPYLANWPDHNFFIHSPDPPTLFFLVDRLLFRYELQFVSVLAYLYRRGASPTILSAQVMASMFALFCVLHKKCDHAQELRSFKAYDFNMPISKIETAMKCHADRLMEVSLATIE